MKFKSLLFFLFSLVFAQSLLISTQAQTKRRSIPAKTKSASIGRATVSIETGLVYQSGEIIPAARTSFYLLDNHLGQIFIDEKVRTSKTWSNPG